MRFLLTPFIIIEALFMIYLIAEFGFFMMFFEVIITAILGFFILLNLNQSLNEGLNALKSGQINPANFLSSQLSKVIGAFLLILPGVLSDIIGLLIQLKTPKFSSKKQTNFRKDDDEIIDVEVIDS